MKISQNIRYFLYIKYNKSKSLDNFIMYSTQTKNKWNSNRSKHNSNLSPY